MILPGTDYSYWGSEGSGDLGMWTGEINPVFSNIGTVVCLLSFHTKWEQARCLPDYCSVKIRQDGVCLDLSLSVFIGVLNAHLNSSNLKNNGYVKAFQQMPTNTDHYHLSDRRERWGGGEAKGRSILLLLPGFTLCNTPIVTKGSVFSNRNCMRLP